MSMAEEKRKKQVLNVNWLKSISSEFWILKKVFNLNKLNGWQRLFILFSICWFGTFYLFFYQPPKYTSPQDYPEDIFLSLVHIKIKDILPEKYPTPDDSIKQKIELLKSSALKKLSFVSSSQGTKRAAYEFFISQINYYQYASQDVKNELKKVFDIQPLDLLDSRTRQEMIIDPFELEKIKNSLKSIIAMPNDLISIYTMDDGRQFGLFGYEENEVKTAYKKTIKAIQLDYYKTVTISYLYQLMLYLVSIIFVYFGGWMIGWVYKGFRQGNHT